MSFQGKRHSQGGMPVKLPEGTFIYSDTSKLRIKDPEILAMFNMGKKKSGYTPAEISKQYLDLNSHIDTLKNPDVDPISRQTAEMMIKKNTAKLGELALIQESMKGFENGIPSIAESALAGLTPEAQARCGGRVKMQNAGELTINGKNQGIPVNSNGNTSQTISTNQSPTTPTFDSRYPVIPSTKRFQDYTLIENILYNPSNDPLLAGASIFHEAVNLPINLGIQGINRLFMHNPFKYDDASAILDPDVAHYPQRIANMLGYTDPNIPNSIPIEPKAVRPQTRSVKYSTPPKQVYINNQPYTYEKTDGNVYTFKSKSNQPFTVTNTYFDQSLDKTPLTKQVSANKTEQYTITSKPSSAGTPNSVKQPSNASTQKSSFSMGTGTAFQRGGTVQFANGGYVDILSSEENKKKRQVDPNNSKRETYKDDQGREHVFLDGTYVGYNKDGHQFRWIDNYEVYQEYDSLNKDKAKFVRYVPPIITKEMKDAALNSEEYKRNVTDFEKMVDEDENYRNGVIANYRKLYPNSKIEDDQIIANLKKQQRVGVTHDVVYGKYYPAFKADEADIWDRPVNPQTGALMPSLMNDIYSQTTKELGLEYTGGSGVGKYAGRDEITEMQKSFIASQQYLQKDVDAQERYRSYGFSPSPTGKDDEGWDYTKTSRADSWAGNTTSYQYNKYIGRPDEGKTDVASPQTPQVPSPTEEINSPPPYEEPRRDIDTWFAPDIMNFVGAMTDRINRYEPSQGKIDLVKPGYDLLSPDRQLAANQEQMARYQGQIENSADSNVGLATMLAASGAGFQNAANVLANVENANVGIVNNAYGQRAAIENQEIASNETMRQKYIQDMAILNQNQDEAENARKWRRIGAWNQGWQNYTKDKMMEEILFPQVHIDNITGEYSFPGGRDPNAIDLYRNYYLGQQSQKGRRQQMSEDDYLEYYKQFSTEYKKQVPDATEEDVRGLFNNWVKMADTDQYMLYGGNVYPF
jgi:hypothetical protein